MAEPLACNTLAARGGVWVVAQSILLLAVILLSVLFHGDWTRIPVIVGGAVLFIAGGYFGIAGMLVLGKNRTPYPRPRAGSELIQHGIYARGRHPLYTSVILTALGWALLWQSAAAFGAAVILISFFDAKARVEARWLCDQFPGYADYARRVPRFLPRLRRAANSVCNF